MTGVPKQIDHLSVGPQACLARMRAEIPELGTHGTFESLRIRLPGDHETGESLARVLQYEVAYAYGLRRFQSLLFESLNKGLPVSGRGDYDGECTLAQSFAKVVTHVLREHALVTVELNHVIVRAEFFTHCHTHILQFSAEA